MSSRRWLDRVLAPDVSVRRALTSKLARTVYAAVVFCGLTAVFLSWRGHHDAALEPSDVKPPQVADPAPVDHHYTKGRFHLLVPATSSNHDFCKLLLSCQVLGYPAPVLINYGTVEDEDPYVQHLAKVEGILNYLENQKSSDPDTEDLVLIIDGYDAWFQLRPDVLIRRYYEQNRARNEGFVKQYGERLVKEHDIRQTVIFGPDKLCWPIDFGRPACWAVPPGTLPQYAFGPQTSSVREVLVHPRWLNSGTIMGPIHDLRDIFNATLNDIKTNYVTNSDQYYFAEIFGRQEFTRLSRVPEQLKERKKETYGVTVEEKYDNGTRGEPTIPDGSRTEYYIGIDYESTMFQTLAFWKQFLTWTRAKDAWWPPTLGEIGSLPYETSNASAFDVRLQDDIAQSTLPFEALGEDEAAKTAWGDVELLYNVVTHEAPVLVHFTGEKRFREVWWNRLWFQSKADTLRTATNMVNTNQISSEPIEGMTWFNAEPDEAEEVSNAGKGGAWSDQGGWFSWKRLCKAHEETLYGETEEMNHPLWHDEPEEPAPEEPEGSEEPEESEEPAKDEESEEAEESTDAEEQPDEKNESSQRARKDFR